MILLKFEYHYFWTRVWFKFVFVQQIESSVHVQSFFHKKFLKGTQVPVYYCWSYILCYICTQALLWSKVHNHPQCNIFGKITLTLSCKFRSLILFSWDKVDGWLVVIEFRDQTHKGEEIDFAFYYTVCVHFVRPVLQEYKGRVMDTHFVWLNLLLYSNAHSLQREVSVLVTNASRHPSHHGDDFCQF